MGDEMNILNGGTEVLEQMKNAIITLDNLKTSSKALVQQQQQLEKEIASVQKEMDSELSTTVAKRQAEVEKTFDLQVEKTREQIKEVRNKKGKQKSSKVSERITNETSELNEKLRSLGQDLKGVFSRQHISRIFNTEYFFTLFMPDGIGDFLIIFLSIIILLAIPVGVYFIIPEAVRKLLYLIIAYVAVIALALLIYTAIYKNVKKKYLDSLTEAKKIRDSIKETKKRIKKTATGIRKDTDESSYGLEKYDMEIAELDKQIESIINAKKEALTVFENQTKLAVTEEIKARYIGKLDELKNNNENAYNEQKAADEQIKTLSVDISKNYEAYIGKENLTVSRLDSLAELINSGDAANIGEAIAYYKKELTDAKKGN